VTVRFSPLTARRILRQSLEKMRLLSVSLGPLTCRTLDHLLCPAGAAAVTCSVLPGAGPQPRGLGWETHAGAARTPGPRSQKHRAAALLRLTEAQEVIGLAPGLQAANKSGQGQLVESTARTSRSGSLRLQKRRGVAQPRMTPAPSPRQPGMGTLDGVAHFLSQVRFKNTSLPPANFVPPPQGTRYCLELAKSEAEW
jgi:hypothetical protein